MRKLLKSIALTGALALGLSVGAFAQNGGGGFRGGMDRMNYDQLNLTEAQKKQVDANREAQREGQEKFNASLTADQKKIMEDTSIQPRERFQKLQASLTADQKAIQQANMELGRKNREAFEASLSAEQKAKYDEMRANWRPGGNRQNTPRND